MLPAQLLWLLVVVPSLVLLVAGLPYAYGELATACAPDSSCPGGREVTPVGAARLRDLGLDLQFYAAARTVLGLLAAGAYLLVGGLIAWRRRDSPLALLVSGVLTVFATMFVGGADALAVAHPQLQPAAEVLGMYGFAAFFVLFYVFPDGRFVPRATLPLTVVLAVVLAVLTIAPDLPVLSAISASGAPLFLLAGTAVAAQVYRYRRVSGAEERQQTRWVVLPLAVALFGVMALAGVWFSSDIVAVEGGADRPLVYLATLALLFALLALVPVGFAVAVLRHQLLDIDLVLNRTLVYLVLTTLVTAAYLAVVGGVGALLDVRSDVLPAVLAAALVAVLFAPLRERVQRAVNRLVYGERDDPSSVVARLGERLEGSLAPTGVLPEVVTTLAEALKAAHVAVEIEDDGRFAPGARTGTPAGEPLVLPLVHRGEAVGRLVLSPRPGTVGFSDADRRLLAGVAPQVAVAVHAEQLRARTVQLSEDLQRSRERLVAAREEERRRLRRDLHDGLGPQLAAITMGTEAARELVAAGAREPADETLAGLTEQAQAAIADVRRLVYGLRPPALDTLGLMEALRSHVALHRSGPAVELRGTGPRHALPAAVEVAAYRIAVEALTNALRHAEADRVTVAVSSGVDGLTIEVTDDGRGLGSGRPSGVGLTSMRERAAELGGSCTVENGSDGGVLVRAVLPLGEEGA